MPDRPPLAECVAWSVEPAIDDGLLDWLADWALALLREEQAESES